MCLKIFAVHNEYQQRGGEGSVVQAEIQLLQLGLQQPKQKV
jgi:hypothetical protein